MRILYLFFGLALVLSSPAGAQLSPRDPSSRFRPRLVDVKVDVRTILDRFARCSVQRHAKAARGIILSSRYELGASEAEIFDTECMPEEAFNGGESAYMSMTPSVVRFSFADALFARELTGFDAAVLSGAPRLPPVVSDEQQLEKWRAKARSEEQRAALAKFVTDAGRDLEYYRVGECVVRSTPALARTILLTKIETAEESEALRQLKPAVERCGYSSKNISFGPADVRGTVAFNYARLAYALGAGVQR